jgi:hypothetical protein
LPQLLTIFNLSFEQLPQLFVIVLKLLAFQSFPEDIFSIIAHTLLVLGNSTDGADHTTSRTDACGSRILLTDVV